MRAQQTGAGRGERPTPKAMHAASGANAAYHAKPLRRQPDELLDRGPPKDPDAERAALAVVLLAPGRIADVAAVLEPEDFLDGPCRTIFDAMLRLHRRGLPPDVTLLVGELRDADEYNADEGVSAAALASLFSLFPTAVCLPHYIARVAEMARRRHALNRGLQLIQAAHRAEPGPSVSPAIRRATQHALEHRTRAVRKGGRR